MSQDILAPPKIFIGSKRCYRVNFIRNDSVEQQQQKIDKAAVLSQGNDRLTYLESDLYDEDYNEAKDDDEYQIEEIPNAMYKLVMHVATSFYGGLIGQKGTTKKRIENETQTEIIVPPRIKNTNANFSAMITVKGKTRSNIIAAKNKIDLLVASLRKRMAPTHFYGIALNFGEIRQKFNILREQILSAELPGIEDKLFQNSCRLHITFGVCTLVDDVERKNASSILEHCREFLDDFKTPFIVHAKGLEIMNDDPTATKVLYASIHAPELQQFANRCYNLFKASPLARDKFLRGNVKLHLTIMSTRKRCTVYSMYNNNYMGNENDDTLLQSFDAREILKRWGNFDFGSIKCNELLLCVISQTSQDTTDEFYKITRRLKFQ